MLRKPEKTLVFFLAMIMMILLITVGNEVYGDEIKVYRSASTSVESFNPYAGVSAQARTLQTYIYSSLLDIVADENGEKIKFVPVQARELPTSEDNITWLVKLRKGLQWTDGTVITADTYEYSLKMLLDPKQANYVAFLLFDNIPVVNAKRYFKNEVGWDEVGIKVIDKYTLKFTLETAMPTVDVYSVFTSLFPVHKELYEAGMNKDRTETSYGTDLESTPSCGPYRLTKWIRDQYREFDKNENSPLADIYKVDRIGSRVVLESATRLQMFENNELDGVSVSGNNFDRYSEDPRLVYSEANTVWGFYINSASKTNPILQNNDFRKALFYGMNRDAISKGVFKTFKSAPYFISTICMVGSIERGQKYRETSAARNLLGEGITYKADLALEYFEKAYQANGNKKITIEIIYFDGSEGFKRLAEVAQQEYEQLFGRDKLKIKLRAVPATAAYDAYEQGDFDLGIGARSQNPLNPWSSMKVWTSDFPQKNDRMYDETFDELYERTTTGDLLLDDQLRLDALVEMERILLDYVPMVPIFQNDNAVIYQDRIRLHTKGKYLPADVGFAVLQSEIIE
ncbi:peptide ABC transporter substrate-binding protein [Iocasia frigidifontis]|uniref:Peptide ABC transporter substrate-binding protein n=1 Tax=Iocasia fonsfrigidae TaxID=2682810 RepID=A0A8A7KGV4_9FIRM|nr:ABC transporter substrate-binding protein [Iocasia fonsfrigidae]QTL98968.1 peptide ABC transporter substrate-binding protein [Iocasia fonsfrigidae]